MALSFQDFLKKYNGQSNVGNTPENKGECVGLVSVWIENLGLPHIWGHAKDLYKNADPKSFEKIPNTPTAVPQKGDIIVWSEKYNGTFGHTGIVTGTGNVNNFEAFEQNDPLGSNCHLKMYSYFAVVGWLRPKVSTPTPPTTTPPMNDQTIIDLGPYGKMEIQAIRGKMGDLKQAQQKVSDLQSKLNKAKVSAEKIVTELS